MPLAAHVPIAGGVSYRFDPDRVYLDDGRFATERTHVAFGGSTAWRSDAQLKFHVTSSDWQESQLVLAGIITDFGSPTGPVPFGGRGEFDGSMTGPFRRPRVEGVFSGEDMRAWDTIWGDGSAEHRRRKQLRDREGWRVRHDGSEIRADGRFSLGYPRRDGGEELDARFRVTRRDLDSLRHAFEIDDYPVSGMLTGEFHLTGEYEHPFGFGSMTIEHGVAYGEPFEQGTAALRFDGSGREARWRRRRQGLRNDDRRGLCRLGLDLLLQRRCARAFRWIRSPSLPTRRSSPSGLLEFTAGGSGLFEAPRLRRQVPHQRSRGLGGEPWAR